LQVFGVVWSLDGSAFKNKPPDFFNCKQNETTGQKLTFASRNEKALKALCPANLHVMAGKLFTFAEEHILLAAKEITYFMCEEKAVK
jgi:hypothetical protein